MAGRGRAPLRRKADWESALHRYLERVRERAHEYGAHDCMHHPASAIRAVTGRDFGRPHRGQYRSRTGAARYLKGLGFRTPEAFIDSLLPEIPVGFAQRGDIVLADGIPGVCIGAEAVFASTEGGGFAVEPRSRWSKAWRVGA